jgi:hypothetical protein
MIGIALTDFGCTIGDVACYCSHPRFGYGVRDCSNQACSAQEAADAIGFANAYCAGKHHIHYKHSLPSMLIPR